MTASLTSTKFGPMLVPPYDVYLSQAMIRQGEYAPDEFETWAPYVRPGAVVVDVGANFGSHTFAFAQAVGVTGMVHAVEPQRMLYYMLCGTIAMLGANNVHPHHLALGRETGEVRVPQPDYSATANFGAMELAESRFGEPVPRMPLDVLRLPRVDFLKIDVEGMELDVLLGASETIKRHRPVMAIEADREQNVAALLGFLRTHGYRAWWHRPALGAIWPGVVSVNLLALPAEFELPEPEGEVEAIEPSGIENIYRNLSGL